MAEQLNDHPGVLIMPPRLYLIALAVAVVLHILAPVAGLEAIGFKFVGVIFVIVGLGVALWAERVMTQAETNINPMQPATAIVNSGPFRFTRNPLYLSLTIIYCGIALIIGSMWAFPILVVVLAVMQKGVIEREEVYLETKFGPEYLTYKRQVRRWI